MTSYNAKRIRTLIGGCKTDEQKLRALEDSGYARGESRELLERYDIDQLYPQLAGHEINWDEQSDEALFNTLKLIELDVRTAITHEPPLTVDEIHGVALDYDWVLSEVRKRGLRERAEAAIEEQYGQFRDMLARYEERTS